MPRMMMSMGWSRLELAPGARWPINRQLLAGLQVTAERLAVEQRRPRLRIRIVSGYRTYAEQVALYERYRNGGPIAAVPGTSRHESGNAADCGVVGGWGGYVSLCDYPGAVAALTSRAAGLAATVYSEPWHIEHGGVHRYPGRVPKHPTCRPGDRGPAVYRIQATVGPANVDGAYGPATTRAVKAWQERHRLTADGITGPTTWATILKAERGRR